MIKVSITIESTNGLTWPKWKRLGQLVEELGFHGLYRSDHFIGMNPPDLPALELWTSLTWLADHTTNIDFGPLVSPVSFRHPAITARTASAVDDLSGGRLVLGLGAGGWEREHRMFGLDLLRVPERLAMFSEGVEVIHSLLHSERPVDFRGSYFHLNQAILLPRPNRAGGPPLLIGGTGRKYSLPLAAKFADEWNGVYLTPKSFSHLSEYLDSLLAKEGRPSESLKRSVLTGCIFGEDMETVRRKGEYWLPKGLSIEQDRAVIRGNGKQFVAQIHELEEAGVDKVILVWFDLEDLDGLEKMAMDVLPSFV